VGRPADRLLQAGGEPRRFGPVQALGTWSGPLELKQGDGRRQRVILRVSPLSVSEAGDGWTVWEAGPAEPLAQNGLNAAVLKTLFEHSPIGVVICDPDLRCTWHNDAISTVGLFSDRPDAEQRITELRLPGRPEEFEAIARHVLDSGGPSLDLKWKLPSATGRDEHSLSVSLYRLDDPHGQPAGVCLIAVDVGASSARQRFSLLVEAGTRIGTTLDVIRTAEELAVTAVPNLADYVTVDLVEAVPLGGGPLERLDSTDISVPVFHRAAAVSIHPDLRESLWDLGSPVYVPPSSPFTAVLHSGESHFEPVLDTAPGTWLEDDPDRTRVIEETGMHTLMIIPLRARGTMLGIAVFVRTENKTPFTRGDLILAEGLADRAALSLDNARRYSRERTVALTLQRDLLPHHVWGGRAVEVASRYLPADTQDRVGGDWFDVIPLSGDRVALVVGDVVGHGISAAAAMGRLRTVVRTLTNMDMSPAEVLAGLDRLVVDMGKDHPSDTSYSSPVMGATCLYGVYDPATRRCTMASAGHLPPAIVSPDGNVHFPALPVGAPIGLGLGNYEAFETELAAGSLIALYTDGLVETRSADIDHGLDRLRTALTLPAATLEDLCATVVDTMLAERQSDDDIALLVALTLPFSG
jgi:serine phosphatase RsbU (regulator of sigma subunit)/PAS domain-containing protein